MLTVDPKRVWYEGVLWDVVCVHRPTKFDDYLTLCRSCDGLVNEDGNDAKEIITIDAHNDTYVPDTTDVRIKMQKFLAAKKKFTKIKNVHELWLTAVWLKQFHED